MNDRQRRFAELVVQGNSGRKAYEEVYDTSGASAEVNASKLLRNPKVEAYVKKLREEAKKLSIFTTASKLTMLYEIARDNQAEDPRVSIAAISEDNRMTGGHTPQKLEVSAVDEFFKGVKPSGGLHNEIDL